MTKKAYLTLGVGEQDEEDLPHNEKQEDGVADEDEKTKKTAVGEPRNEQGDTNDFAEIMEEEIPNDEPKTKAQALKSRLRQLKMKMNQARQLNRREVMREGERLGSLEGMTKEQKRQAKADKKLQNAEWEARNAKAMEIGASSGIDSKLLVEQAGDSVRKAEWIAEKEEKSRFSVKDYYNPEGQHRNYERNLKSLPRAQNADSSASSETFNPMMIASTGDEKTEREGARRLAKELRRRIEKQHNSKRKIEFEEADVSYINQRNKRFNEKISRNFDKHTAEIRQNLERGTAL